MPEENLLDVRKKIAGIIRIRGPSLPVHIARETGINSLFAGALLSELSKDKIIKISNMKVGGSPLYFLQGQEVDLEKFHDYLPGKEKEAFLLLRGKGILKDAEQQPAIRVALRNLKDFAMSFLKDNEIFWRFHSVSEQEVRNLLEPTEKPREKKEVIKKLIEKPIKKPFKAEIKKSREKPKQEKQLEIGLEKPEKARKERKIRIKKPKQKSGFVLKVIDFLKKQGIEILEEKDIKKKEFSAKVRVDSMLGKLKLLCVAKDKKRITENDLRLVLQKAQNLKLPALVIFPGELNKKAQFYSESWSSLLRLKKLE